MNAFLERFRSNLAHLTTWKDTKEQNSRPKKPTKTTAQNSSAQLSSDLSQLLKTKTPVDDCPLEHALLPITMTTLERRWRFSLYNALQQRKATTLWRNVCDLSEIFVPDSVRVLTSKEKQSSSSSVILTGVFAPPVVDLADSSDDSDSTGNVDEEAQELQRIWKRIKCDIVVKLSMPALDDPLKNKTHFSPLDAEIMMYRFAGELVDKDVTPNLVLGLAKWECSYRGLQASQDPQTLKTLRKSISEIYLQELSSEPSADDLLRFLVLERGRGASLEAMMKNGTIDEDKLMTTIFQLLYTIDCLNRRYMRHGDLHSGNVFVDQLTDASTSLAYIPYFSNDSLLWFSVPTNGFVPKIYDWDFGGVYNPKPGQKTPTEAWPMPPRQIINEHAINFCNSVSSCGYNQKADTFTLLSSLYQMPETQQFHRFQEFVRRSIDPRLLEFQFNEVDGYIDRLCSGVIRDDFNSDCSDLSKYGNIRIRGGKCNGPWEPSDCLMRTPAQMMLDDAFLPYRRTTDPDDNDGTFAIPWQTTPYVYGNWPTEEQYQRVSSQAANYSSESTSTKATKKRSSASAAIATKRPSKSSTAGRR
jgi:hypothetical protein